MSARDAIPRQSLGVKRVVLRDVDVVGILEGRKTQMRFPINPAPFSIAGSSGTFTVHFGQQLESVTKGEALWVAEAFRISAVDERQEPGLARQYFASVLYRSDSAAHEVAIPAHDYRRLLNRRPRGWSAAHLMPTWASRLQLAVDDVRVENLQDITEADAIAEGSRYFRALPTDPLDPSSNRWSVPTPRSTRECLSSAQFAFANDFCKQHSVALDFDLWDRNIAVRAIQFSVTRRVQ